MLLTDTKYCQNKYFLMQLCVHFPSVVKKCFLWMCWNRSSSAHDIFTYSNLMNNAFKTHGFCKIDHHFVQFRQPSKLKPPKGLPLSAPDPPPSLPTSLVVPSIFLATLITVAVCLTPLRKLVLVIAEKLGIKIVIIYSSI